MYRSAVLLLSSFAHLLTFFLLLVLVLDNNLDWPWSAVLAPVYSALTLHSASLLLTKLELKFETWTLGFLWVQTVLANVSLEGVAVPPAVVFVPCWLYCGGWVVSQVQLYRTEVTDKYSRLLP
jgi:hypothetical protein